MTAKLSSNEAEAMSAWIGASGDFGILSFKAVAVRCSLGPHLVRRTVRALARKGLLVFARCSWSDDGEMMGAGYEPTAEGWRYLDAATEILGAAA